MLRKTVGMSRVLQKLPAAPGLSEIHHYLSQAMEKRGKQVVISWPTPDRAMDFTLEILFPVRGGDTEWNLYSGADRKKELLWEYKTCDVLLVYNLIVSSCGEVNRTVVADGAISVSESFRDQSKKRDTYYMQAMQSQMVDSNVQLASMGLKDNSWSRGTTEMVGDLSLIQIPNLFQSINVAKMTGCLEVSRKNEKAQVFFVDGEPVFAEMPKLNGDECILELVTIREGKYEFHPRMRTDKKNVQQNIESLVMRGVQLKDRISYLKNAGLWPESIIRQKNPNLTRQEFDARCSYNPPVSLNLLRNLFTSIDDRTTLKKIVNKLQIPMSAWVPAVCYLLEQDLITFSNDFGNTETNQNLLPKNIDKSAIHSVMMGLRRAETGMFTYPAFLYFLEQEYFRGYRSGSPLSVMVMEMREVKGPPDFARQPLGIEAVAEVFRRISQLKRHIDLLAHYEQYDYAMILPNTKSAGANVFAQRIVSALLSKPLPGGIDSSKLSLSFGIACIPEDCVDLSYILAAAESAKAQAILLAAPVIIYRDIRVEAESPV